MTLVAIAILVLGFFAIQFGLRRKTMRIKIIASVIYVIVFGAMYMTLFVVSWKFSEDPREARSGSYSYKRIRIINNSKKQRKIYISYVRYDSVHGNEINIKDSLQLANETHNNSGMLQIPLNTNEDVNFLKDFSLIVKDSLNQEIEAFDELKFLDKASTLPGDLINKRSAEIWTIEVN